MATVTSSLRMFDQMSPILRIVKNSFSQTVTAMDGMEKSISRSFDKRPIESTSRSIKQVESSLNGITPPIERARKSQDNFNLSLNDGHHNADQLLGKITGLVGAYVSVRAAMSMLNTGFEVFKEYEQSMSRVKALSGANSEEVKRLGAEAKRLGDATQFSAAQAADGMAFLAMAGYKTNDIIAAMPGLLATAAAGQMELGRTADIVSNVLSGFNMRSDETARVADVLTKAFTSSNTDLNMIGETMKYLAPNAKAAGYSLEEMAAAAGILGNNGIQASMAGTSLRAIISRMAAPTGEAADLMEALNIKVVNADGSLKKMASVIEEVSRATDGMGNANKIAAIKMLIGEEAASSFLALMSAGPQALRDFTTELENSAGTAENIAAIMIDNTAGKLELFRSKVDSAWINFYERLGSSDGMSDAFDSILNGLYAALEMIIPVFETIITYAGIVVNFFTEHWSTIQPIVESLGVALGALILILTVLAAKQLIWNAIMNANPIFLIITLVIALVTYLIRLWQTNDAFVAGFMRAWNGILNFFDQVPIFFAWVGNGIINAFYKAKVTVLKIVDSMANSVINTINKLINAVKSIGIVSIDTIANVEFSTSAAIEAEAIRQAGDAKLDSMQSEAASKAAAREANVQALIADRAADRAAKDAAQATDAAGLKNLGGAGVSLTDVPDVPTSGGGNVSLPSKDKSKIGKVGKVDKVGKIEKAVDISSEDLKTMRELAEMKNIQNFVTLTPTVQVTTGDVNNGTDIDTIVARIEDVMTEQISTYASGVYNGG